jgi:hypothetical protein
MLVETYECEETATETPELSAEAVELIDKLGLEGQQQLLSRDDDRTERVPYRQMTKEEIFVFGTICPVKTALIKFDSEPMPLRVLQVAAHAKSLDIFKELQVWHRKSSAVKDPVLVGLRTIGYETQTFILARWGEALDEMPFLIKTAMAAWKEQMRDSLNEVIAKATSDLASLDSCGFGRAARSSPLSFYGGLA